MQNLINNIKINNNYLSNNNVFNDNYKGQEIDPYKYHMAVLNSTRPLKDNYRLLGCNYFMTYSISWINLGNFVNRLLLHGINELIILRVLEDNLYNITKQEENFQKMFANNMYCLNSDNTTTIFSLLIHTVSITELFDLKFFKNEILTYKEKNDWSRSFNTLFCFEGITLPELLLYFKLQKILYSQGSSKLRSHVIPIKFRLSQIISSIELGSIKGINNSFHLPERFIQFNNKEFNLIKLNINWEII